MLLELAQWLSRDQRFFAVFNYITLRAVLATLTALAIGLFAGPWLIRKLAQMKIGQAVRTDGPQTHLAKSGTPTMGGALILVGVGFATLLWADLSNRFIWAVLLVTLGITWWMAESRMGFYLRAIRDSERAARSLGAPASRVKLYAFMLSAGLTSVAGALYATMFGFVDPESGLGILISVKMLIMAVVAVSPSA